MRERSLWRVAVALSLVLHALVAYVLSQVAAGGTGASGRLEIVDTRAKSPPAGVDLDVVLLESPHPKAPVASPRPASVANTQAAPAKENPTRVPTAPPLPAPPLPARTGDPGPGAGSAATTSFFQIGTRGKTIAYVIDRSSSMGCNGLLETAKQELLASLDKLPPDARFQVIFYNRTPELLSLGGTQVPIPATPENKRQIAQCLHAVQAEGGTEHLRALQRALALHPDVIYFLTDADDLNLDLVRIVTNLNHGHTAIHAIELNVAHRTDEYMPLPQLARNNKGVYRGFKIVPGG